MYALSIRKRSFRTSFVPILNSLLKILYIKYFGSILASCKYISSKVFATLSELHFSPYSLSISNTFCKFEKYLSLEQSTKLGVVRLRGKAESMANFEPCDQEKKHAQNAVSKCQRKTNFLLSLYGIYLF